MENKDQNIESTIDKLNEGLLLTCEERAELDRWAALSPDNAARLHDEAEITSAAHAATARRRFDADAAFSRFLARTRENRSLQEVTLRPRRLLRRWAAAAAIVAAVALTGAVAYEAGAGRRPAYGMLTAAAPSGSTAIVTLPDGTTVDLNSGSSIAYSQGFGITDRDIRLNGQGHFTVRHDAALPLRVTTAHATVSDIGTAFDLRDYADDSEAVVTVTEGAVNMAPAGVKGNRCDVRAGQTARLDVASGTISVGKSAADSPYQWRRAVVKLSGQSMTEIADILSRAYGVTVAVKSRRAEALHFNGEFNLRVCSLTDVLEALAATNNISYSVKGSLVEIR
ncbi:MAG: FecR domain-containing protein [Prevotella sp.]|nr:FecR domain-containing protein [Prevotella sp.]MDY5686399.1 FecR domain-containing protein [Prevotella sp.]